MKQAVGFFQLSLVLVLWCFAKTKIISHPGEYSQESLNFNNQTQSLLLKVFLRPSSDYFLSGLSLGSAKRAGPVLSPDSHPSPVNSPVLLCWHQHSCSNGVTRLRELIQIKISRGKKLSAVLIPSFSRSVAALAAGWCWRQGWERAARGQSRTSPLGSHFQVDWIKRVVKVSSESHLQKRFVC